MGLKKLVKKLFKTLFAKWDKFERRLIKQFSPSQRRLWQILIFLIRFALLAVPLHFLIWLNFDATALQEGTAWAVERFMSLLPMQFSREGIFFFVQAPDGLLKAELVRECVGWKSALALAGLIFAVRGVALKKRVLGLAVGLPLIFVGNIVRLGTTFYLTASWGLGFFEVVHSFLWQWGLILLVLGTWILWLNRIALK